MYVIAFYCLYTGLYCEEKRLKSDVCHEIHEQSANNQKTCCRKCFSGD